MTFSARINKLFQAGRWAEARALLEPRLKAEPNSHWLLTRLGTTYYEELDYRKALQLSRRAYKLAPRCPLVLWDLASTLEMIGEDRKALDIYKTLFALGPKGVAEEECGEGINWASALLTDCLYSAAGCLHRLGEQDAALACIQQHLEMRALGVKSIYSLREARKRLADVAGPRQRIIDQAIGETQRRLQAV